MATPLTKPYFELIRKRARRDPEFRRLMYLQAVKCLSEGDIVMGKVTIHDYIDATIGFAKLAKALKKSPIRLKRMLNNDKDTCGTDLVAVMEYLRNVEGLKVDVICKAKPSTETSDKAA